jgi:hypothetical protein
MGLDFLGFLRPIQGFSMGYGQSNNPTVQSKKIVDPFASGRRPAPSCRHWSQSSGLGSRPAEPLVSFQINRQLSGWNLPPLVIRVIRAFGMHRTKKECNGKLSCLLTYIQHHFQTPH